MSQPCCMKAPSENQRELKMPNSLGGWSVGPCSVAPSSGSSACHSYGLKRLTWDSKEQEKAEKCQPWYCKMCSTGTTSTVTHQKQHNTDSNVSEDYAHPDLIGQWIQERKNTWFRLLRFLDHDGNTQRHKGLGEVDHLLSHQRDGQWGYCNFCFLWKKEDGYWTFYLCLCR